jgi:hypothetical protein
MPDEAPVMTATRPVMLSVLKRGSSFGLKSVGELAFTVAAIGET